MAFFLNLGFTLLEVVGGLFTNSIAILSDALHDLGDTISLGLAWYFQNISKKQRDEKFSYGYGRFSVLGAIINALVLVGGSVFIISEAVPRLINPENPDTTGMMWLAVVGVVVNGAAVIRLKRGTSINEKVMSLHLMEDVLGWVAVLVGSIVMKYYDAPIIDPILSLGIAAYILTNVYKNIRNAFKIILQGTPSGVNVNVISSKIERIENVKGVHDCHVWSMDGEYNVLTVDLMAEPEITLKSQEVIKEQVWNIMKDENIHHVTIEFDSSINPFNHPQDHQHEEEV